MKTLKLTLIFLLFLTQSLVSSDKNDDLNPKKMTSVTEDILEIFVSGKSDNLRKFISREWLDKNNIKVDKYQINNYSPESFEIISASGDLCVATVGGKSWKHILIFKFTNENGIYRVVPKGISSVNSEYIDPWTKVIEYVCSSTDPENDDK